MHTWQPRSRIQARTSSARAAFWPRMHAFSSVLKVTLVGSSPPAISSLYLNQEHNGLILPFCFRRFVKSQEKTIHLSSGRDARTIDLHEIVVILALFTVVKA